MARQQHVRRDSLLHGFPRTADPRHLCHGNNFGTPESCRIEGRTERPYERRRDLPTCAGCRYVRGQPWQAMLVTSWPQHASPPAADTFRTVSSRCLQEGGLGELAVYVASIVGVE